VASDHDSIDHGYAAKAHPAIHLKSARLSWQHPFNREPPAPWKIGVVIIIVLAALTILNLLQDWRVGVHMTHMRAEIRDNVVTLADAAAQYMADHHVTSVKATQLPDSSPDFPLKHLPTTIIGESYSDKDFTATGPQHDANPYANLTFSLDDPTVWVHIPNGPNLSFNIRWHHEGDPDFVSAPAILSK